MTNYSKNEMVLIRRFDCNDIARQQTIAPPELWHMLALRAFLLGENDAYTDAVRRGLAAVKNCSPYRDTPEFERLIAVGPTDA